MGIKTIGITILATLSICSFANGSTSTSQRSYIEGNDDFTLAEAKLFLKSRNQELSLTKANSAPEKHGLSLPPGEFVPVWEQANQICNQYILYFDVPIKAQARYKAFISVPGKSEKEEVRIYQRLMVAKNMRNQQKFYYFTTFIPDPDFDERYICEGFERKQQHNHYSGLVLYINPRTGTPVRVNRYKEGKRTAGIFLGGKPENAVRETQYTDSLIKNVHITKTSLTSPRSYDEDEWEKHIKRKSLNSIPYSIVPFDNKKEDMLPFLCEMNNPTQVPDRLYDDLQCTKYFRVKSDDVYKPDLYLKIKIPNSDFIIAAITYGGSTDYRTDLLLVTDTLGNIKSSLIGTVQNSEISIKQYKITEDCKIITSQMILTSQEPILYKDFIDSGKSIEAYRLNSTYSINSNGEFIKEHEEKLPIRTYSEMQLVENDIWNL